MLTQERKDACVTAYGRGWRQDDTGAWWRPGTDRDGLTLHHPDDDSEHGYVLASTTEEALRVDRETFGDLPDEEEPYRLEPGERVVTARAAPEAA